MGTNPVLHQRLLRKGTALLSPDGQGLEPGSQGFSVNLSASDAAGTTDLIFPRNV